MSDVGGVGGLGGLAHPTDAPTVGPQQAKSVDPARVLNREMRRSERDALAEFQHLQKDSRLNSIAAALRFMKRARPKKDKGGGGGGQRRRQQQGRPGEAEDVVGQAAESIANGADPKSTVIELIAGSDKVNDTLSDLKRALAESGAPQPLQVAAMESIVQGRIDFMQPTKAEEVSGLRQKIGDLVGRDVLRDMAGNLKHGLQAHSLLHMDDIDLSES